MRRSTEAGVSRTVYAWAGVERIVQEDGYLLFFVDQCVAYGIPWQAFASQEARMHFVERALAWHEAASSDGNNRFFS